MRRTTSLVATALLSLVVLAGCGDEEPAPASGAAPSSSSSSSAPSADGSSSEADGSASPSEATSGAVIDITVDGDDITPNGERVEVEVGEPISFDVTADAPGEIHVHSTPEQEYEYAAGTSTITLTPIARPGIVDVESHTLDKTIVQLQVQ